MDIDFDDSVDVRDDYWTVATVLELACFNHDEDLARRCLPRAVMLARKANELWCSRQRDNLALIAKRRRDAADAGLVTHVIAELDRAPRARYEGRCGPRIPSCHCRKFRPVESGGPTSLAWSGKGERR